MYSNGGWGTEGSNQKVPDVRKARASQDPTGMTLAEIPLKGEGEAVETLFRGIGTPTHLQNFNLELLLSKGNTGTESGTETKGKTIQRLPHLGIHPIYSHQTQTLLLMPWSACWQEPDTAVS